MELKATYINHMAAATGEVSLNFKLTGDDKRRKIFSLGELLTKLQSGNKPLRLGVDIWREQRSKDANSYFHVIINKIAAEVQSSDDEIKYKLVTQYGTLAEYEGGKVIFKLPKGVDPLAYYKYSKYVGSEVDEYGVEWYRYAPYKETHLCDSKEMARLIQGAIDEAQKIGIDTKTPEEIASMLALMEEHEKQKSKSV